ncbi:MAG: hypothetical protein QXS93_00065 [Candidatus Micrarchaeia archaeon]
MRSKTCKLLNREGIKLFLKEIAGENAPMMAQKLLEPISDEDLAKKCGMRAADVRMILNKLHNSGVIDYNRSKDKDSGWYYYAWFLRADKLLEIYINKKKTDLEEIERRLENNDIYSIYLCSGCEQTYDFDRASELLYHCPLCERILDKNTSENDLKRMKRIANNIRKEISDIKAEFKEISGIKYKTMKVI